VIINGFRSKGIASLVPIDDNAGDACGKAVASLPAVRGTTGCRATTAVTRKPDGDWC